MEVGTRVKYIRTDSEESKESGYYPPVGTFGTVMDVVGNDIEVKWDSGTKDNGVWWCDIKDVAVSYHYEIDVLIGNRRFSHNCSTAEDAYDALCGIFNTIPNTKRDDVDFKKIIDEMELGDRVSYNVCPIAIYHIIDRD